MTTIVLSFAAGAVALAGFSLMFRLIRRAAFFAVAGLAAIVCALWGVKALQFSAMAAHPFAMPPETVTTAVAAEQEWTPAIEAVGSLAPVQGVTLAAEMDGKVVGIAFDSGAAVKAGDVLVQLDVATEQAQLRSAEAAAELARLNLGRSRQLLESHTISQSEFDSADAQCKQALAQADNIRSIIEKKTIRAPFSGRAGIREVNLGQIVRAGDPIVSLQSLDPIYANFTVPEQDFSQLAPGLPVEVRTDALPGQVVTGRITAINPDIDNATRNFRVQTTLANPGQRLRPGMFIDASVLLAREERVLVIPATAVLYAPYGDSVFVVEERKDGIDGRRDKVLRQQFVRLGDRRGDFVAVTGGLKAGEEVVSTGVFKLRNGSPVMVNNALSPRFQLAPKPGNS
jgi:membrane fusion protein (multidrug efflux system)